MTRPLARCSPLLFSALLAACVPQHLHVTDCGFDRLSVTKSASKVKWTRTAAAGQLTGRVLDASARAAPVQHAWLLLVERGSSDTLRIPVDSTGVFRSDSVPLGKRNVVIEARWYWAAFDSIDVRPDSGLRADVRLEATPQGFYGCIPH